MPTNSVVQVMSSFSDKCDWGRNQEEFEHRQYENFETGLFGDRKKKSQASGHRGAVESDEHDLSASRELTAQMAHQ